MLDHDSRFSDLVKQATQERWSRRDVLKRAAALGLSAPAIAAVLAACGGSDATPTADSGDGGAATQEATGTSTSGGATSTAAATETETASGGGSRGGGGTLKLIWWQAPTILNAHLSQGTKDFDASRVHLETLADFNSDDELVPVLAAEIPSLDNGGVAEDGMSVTWKLKQGVTWHDGQPFTANDVKFTWEYASNPETAATTAGVFAPIESIDVIDDHTVRINFKDRNPGWFNVFTGENGMILPEHLLRDHVGNQARAAEFNLKPIGTGPYKVVEFRPGDVVVWEINENYHEEGKPFFDSVEMKGGGDAVSAARAVLQTGDMDWAWNLQVEDAVLKQLEAAGQGVIVTVPGGGTEKMLINHSDPETELDGQRSHKDVPHPHFQDKRVRQALALSIQRDVIAQTLYGAGGEPTALTMNEVSSLMPDDLTWEFNLEKAKALLDEAGATVGSDGIRELNGRKMKWLYQTSVNQIRQKHQEIVKAALKEIGIDAELKSVDATIYFSGDPSNNDTTGHFYADIEMYTNNAESPFPVLWYRRYLSTEIAQKENEWASDNYMRYSNPKFDELYNQVSTELDPDKYTEIFLEMQRLVVEDVAEIGVVARKDVAAASKSLQGYNPTPWASDLWDLKNWTRA